MSAAPESEKLPENVFVPAEASSADPASSPRQPGLAAHVFGNTAALLGGRAFAMLCSAGTSILLARFLGRERIGEYGAIYAYVGIFTFLASFGLEQIIAREISTRKSQAAEILHTAKITALFFGVFASLMALILGPLFGYHGLLRWLVVIASIDLLLLPPFRFTPIILQVEMRLWQLVIIGLARSALWFLAILFLALGSAAFVYVILARTLCGVFECLLMNWWVHRTGLVQGTKRFMPAEARQLVRFGFPIVLSILATTIYQRIDQVMLHRMAGDYALAPYVIAVQVTEMINNLPITLMMVMFPLLAQAASDEQRFGHYLKSSFRLLLVVAFAACAVLIPLAAPLVKLLYGSEFGSSADLVVVLIWSNVPIFFLVVITNAMVATRLQHLMPYSAVAGALSNIVLNLILIPRYGAIGAAWATVISYCLAGILLFLCIPSTRPFVLIGLRVGAAPFVIVVLLTSALHFFHWAIWVKLALSILCYSVGILMTRTLLRSDLERAWRIVRERFG
jgi:O-antigen/teichoic acid export membrane protein